MAERVDWMDCSVLTVLVEMTNDGENACLHYSVAW